MLFLSSHLVSNKLALTQSAVVPLIENISVVKFNRERNWIKKNNNNIFGKKSNVSSEGMSKQRPIQIHKHIGWRTFQKLITVVARLSALYGNMDTSLFTHPVLSLYEKKTWKSLQNWKDYSQSIILFHQLCCGKRK